mgnify:CR=1 FL=1
MGPYPALTGSGNVADLLAPGLWWLHGTRGSNVFLVEADDGQLALIDTGFASSVSAINKELHAHGGALAAILLTHKHRDHSGSAAVLHERFAAPVIAGRGDCFEREGRLFLRSTVGRTHVGRFVAGSLRRGGGRPVAVDLAVTEEAEILPGIRAVPVPGHTPGSLCFVVERLHAAFVGDLVISHHGELTRSMRMANHDDDQYLEALRQFGAIAPGAGLPGHGTPIMHGFGDALRTLAALPRRPMGIGTTSERIVRIARFSRQLSRRRRHLHSGHEADGAQPGVEPPAGGR